jgi:hypothetical protein
MIVQNDYRVGGTVLDDHNLFPVLPFYPLSKANNALKIKKTKIHA